MELLIFSVEEERYAVRAADVQEIVPAVTIARVPSLPGAIEGVINLRGVIVPVLDVRARFGLAARPPAPTDHLIVLLAGSRIAAVRADRALELVPIEEADIDRAVVARGAGYIAGVAKLPSGVALIHDPSRFLSQAESAALERELSAGAPMPVPAPGGERP